MFLSLLLTSVTLQLIADPKKEDRHQLPLCSELKIKKICAEAIKAHCIETENLNADAVCVDSLQADRICSDRLSMRQLCADEISTKTLCAFYANLEQVYAGDGSFDRIWTSTLVVDSICANDGIKACSLFAAEAVVSHDTTYTLGDPVNFDLIVRDPSGSFISPNTFRVPESGFYIFTVQLAQKNLTGPSVISGTPIADLEVYVNGFRRRELNQAFLTFSDEQTSILTSLIDLQQGDLVHIEYEVLVIDPLSGLMEYPGFVTLIGSPTPTLPRTLFTIHYLSSFCPVECTPNPVPDIDCTACQPVICEPCESCNTCPQTCESPCEVRRKK